MLPQHFSKPASPMHHWLAERCDNMRAARGCKTNVIGPRGGAKSTVVTLAAVLRAAVVDEEPYIWLISDTHSQAKCHLQNLKQELTENPHLHAAYPQATGVGDWWRSGSVRLANGVVIEAYGAGQRLRGRRRGADRPSLIVCDDLENEEHASSARLRDASREWFFGTLLKAGARRTNVINLATALHRDALAVRLNATPGWCSRVFASIRAWPDRMDLWQEWESHYRRPATGEHDAWRFYCQNRQAMDAGAVVLWPAEEDLYTLMRMRAEGGAAAFEREKQSVPVDPERCEWPPEYFGQDAWFDAWPRGLKLRTLALDPSKGADARQGDYSAYVMLGIDQHGVLYVQADLGRRSTAQMVSDGIRLVRSFKPHAFGIESNQWQQLLAAEFVEECRRCGVLCPTPHLIENRNAKVMRIRRLGPYLSQRRLRFKQGCASTRLLVEQLQDFPVGSHDDGPDALEMALRIAETEWQSRTQTDDLGDRLPIGS